MEAGAAVGTLHPAVTAKEVTTHAQREAMRLVFTEELLRGHRGHLGNGGVVAVVVDQALHLVQVLDEGEPVIVAGVDHPLHVTAAVKRILRHQERGSL